MKRVYTLFIALLSVVASFAQESDVEINGAWMKKHYSKTEYMIPMQDGVKLYTAVYTPKNKKIQSPILLCRTQNGCEPYGKKAVALWRKGAYKQYLQAEYILVFQDVRGQGKSEGNFADAQLPNDAYSTVNWLQRKVRRYNGNVGVWGSGEDGMYAIQAAMCGHPSIKAVSPQAILKAVDDIDTPMTAAMLFVGGLFDGVSKSCVWESYKSVAQSNKNLDCRIVVGPWLNNAWCTDKGGTELGEEYFSQDATSEFYRQEVEFPFFDYYLRGGEDSGASSAGALIYFTGENCWREISNLNKIKTEEVSLYLSENNYLTTRQSQEIGLSTSYVFNPDEPTPYHTDSSQPLKPEYIVAGQQFLENRRDVLTFTADAIEEDITAIGEVELFLYAYTQTDGIDFVVKIIDESANNEQEMMVRAEMFRNSPNNYEECEGGVRKYKFRLSNIAHTFLAGHRIKLQIQSAWYPLYDVTQKTPCEVYIHHDKEHVSAIKFHIIK